MALISLRNTVRPFVIDASYRHSIASHIECLYENIFSLLVAAGNGPPQMAPITFCGDGYARLLPEPHQPLLHEFLTELFCTCGFLPVAVGGDDMKRTIMGILLMGAMAGGTAFAQEGWSDYRADRRDDRKDVIDRRVDYRDIRRDEAAVA